MPIWCPKCHAKSVRTKFYDDRCPQCRTVVGIGEVLTKDPYSPKVGNKQSGMRKQKQAKKFVFDQKAGSDTDTTPGSIPSVNTELLGFIE